MNAYYVTALLWEPHESYAGSTIENKLKAYAIQDNLPSRDDAVRWAVAKAADIPESEIANRTEAGYALAMRILIADGDIRVSSTVALERISIHRPPLGPSAADGG